jgi:hypothetical protein
MNKTCGKFMGEREGKKMYCGRAKWFGNKKVKEYCEVCKSYNCGFEDGFAEKIKKIRTCQIVECPKSATHVICEGKFLINVCRGHARNKDARKIEKDDL